MLSLFKKPSTPALFLLFSEDKSMAKRQLTARNTEIQYPKELGPLSLSFTVQILLLYLQYIAVDRVTKPSSKKKRTFP